LTLILLTGLSVLSLNMFLPSLSNIAEAFDVEYSLMSVSISGYLVVAAVLQLIMGPLSDRIGRRPIVLMGLAMFVVASVGCLLAQSVWVFLGFRLLQGAVVGGMIVSRAIVRDTAEPAEAARLLGLIGTAMALAPFLGPSFGGMLDQLFGWRANFIAYALAGLVMLAICWRDLGETNSQPSATFAAQFRQYPELFRSRVFWGYTICLVFSIGAFYAFIAGAPHIGSAAFGLSAGWLGAGIGVISGGFMAGTYLSARLAHRMVLLRIVLVGRVCASVGPLIAIFLLAAGFWHPVTFFAGAVSVGFGNGLTVPGGNVGVMSVDPQLAGSASGLSGALTVVGGAVFTFVSGVFSTGPGGAYILLGLMSLLSATGLLSMLWLIRAERREGHV
jgi:DHA1 family bicyclomycin/chloramphenicol resistance-like MFS transporter